MGRDSTGHSQRQIENSPKRKSRNREPEDPMMTMTMTKMMTKCRKELRNLRKRREICPIRTDPENDVIQILTDGKIPQGEKVTANIKRSDRNTNRPNTYGSIPHTKNFGLRLIIEDNHDSILEQNKRNSSTGEDPEARGFHSAGEMTLSGTAQM